MQAAVPLKEAVAACEAAGANTQASKDARQALAVALQHTLDATSECERLGADIVRAAAEPELPEGECRTHVHHLTANANAAGRAKCCVPLRGWNAHGSVPAHRCHTA